MIDVPVWNKMTFSMFGNPSIIDSKAIVNYEENLLILRIDSVEY